MKIISSIFIFLVCGSVCWCEEVDNDIRAYESSRRQLITNIEKSDYSPDAWLKTATIVLASKERSLITSFGRKLLAAPVRDKNWDANLSLFSELLYELNVLDEEQKMILTSLLKFKDLSSMSFVSIYSLSLYFAVPIAEEASMQVPKVIDESFSHSDKNQLKALIDSTVKGLRENEMPNLAVNRISHYNQFVFKAVMRTLNEIGTNKR